MSNKLKDTFIAFLRNHEEAHYKHQKLVDKLNNLPSGTVPGYKEEMLYAACQANMTGGRLEGFVTALILIIEKRK